LHDFSGKIASTAALADARADDPGPLAGLLQGWARGSLTAQRGQRKPAPEQREPLGFRRAHPHFF
jgi:hypothetical protein